MNIKTRLFTKQQFFRIEISANDDKLRESTTRVAGSNTTSTVKHQSITTHEAWLVSLDLLIKSDDKI